MSVTAFPVLARILAERGVLRTSLGSITLSCAAVDDVTAWCILAFVVSIARAEGMAAGLVTTGLAAAFIAVVVFGVRPLLQRLGPRQGQSISAETVAIAFFLVLVAATTTEVIGIHALFGAFLLGAVMPRRGGLTHALTEKIEDFVTIVLLPLFFAYSGLRTRIGLLDDASDWAWCAAVVLVACAGKFGGSAIAARLVGLRWRDASAIGVLMNTRGLMELIVLNVGLDLGVLTPRLFTMMVVMALVTTWITSPVLEWIYPRAELLRELEPSPGAALLLCVSDPAIVPALLGVTRTLVPPGEPLLALHVVRSDRP
jgi:Kef-type K+ transport system membrane component KefB